MPADTVAQVLDGIDLDLQAFDATAAQVVGELRGATRERGLSLGDRACWGSPGRSAPWRLRLIRHGRD